MAELTNIRDTVVSADVLISASRVALTGKAIRLDMSDAVLALARVAVA